METANLVAPGNSVLLALILKPSQSMVSVTSALTLAPLVLLLLRVLPVLVGSAWSEIPVLLHAPSELLPSMEFASARPDLFLELSASLPAQEALDQLEDSAENVMESALLVMESAINALPVIKGSNLTSLLPPAKSPLLANSGSTSPQSTMLVPESAP